MQLIPQGLWWAAWLVWGQAGCGSALQTLFHGEQGCRAGGGGGVYPFGESPALPPAPCRAHHCLGPGEGGKAGGGLGFPGSVFSYKCLSHPQGTWYSRCPRTLGIPLCAGGPHRSHADRALLISSAQISRWGLGDVQDGSLDLGN